MRDQRGASFAALAVALLLAAGGCGEEGKSFTNGRIVDVLGLEEFEGGYVVNGDPFCEVEAKLLNDSDEVEEALDDASGLVLASREGNVGIEGVEPFAPDCAREARQRLDRLDPRPREN